MLLWLVHRKRNTGFTLIEMLVTVIVVAVIAAIASPNLLGLLNRNRVNSALEEVEGAIKEAQKQAMRNGTSCTINIDDSSDSIQTDNAISGGCLLSTRSLNDLVRFNSNVATVAFSGKGNTNASSIFVVSMENGTPQKKCLVVSSGLGIMRTGNYTGTLTGATPTLAETSCQ
jgi:prepilin-type N-terminal cleavage/methylation domain-containing protein